MIPTLISPKQHGINDYGFGVALATLPTLMGMNKKAIKIYGALALNTATFNAVTDHGLGIPIVSMKTHKKLDLLNVGLIYGLTLADGIRNDKKALWFNIGLAALASLNVLLTDYKVNKEYSGIR